MNIPDYDIVNVYLQTPFIFQFYQMFQKEPDTNLNCLEYFMISNVNAEQAVKTSNEKVVSDLKIYLCYFRHVYLHICLQFCSNIVYCRCAVLINTAVWLQKALTNK